LKDFSVDNSFINPNGSKSTEVSALKEHIGAPQRTQILDVRKAEDFALSDHLIAGAIRWDYLTDESQPVGLTTDVPVVAYCVKGAHVGVTAAEKLTTMGYTASYLEGGIRSWAEGNAPTVKKRPDLGVTGETADDHQMLEAAMPMYDALYSWAQSVVAGRSEQHNWKPN
jgi:rhodanese-related sulfurtransferase